MESRSHHVSRSISAGILPRSRCANAGRQVTPQPNSVVILPQRESHITQAGAVISKIEAIFESIMDCLANGAGKLSIPYRNRTATRRSRRTIDEGEQAVDGPNPDGAVTFPGRTPQEARKFGRLVCSLYSAVSYSFSSFCLQLLSFAYLRSHVKLSLLVPWLRKGLI